MKYEKLTERLHLRLTPAERSSIEHEAKHARRDLTSYVLARVLSAQDAAKLLRAEPRPTSEPHRGWLSWFVGRDR
jgi:uncharacterized protein (DUF1778 family)